MSKIKILIFWFWRMGVLLYIVELYFVLIKNDDFIKSFIKKINIKYIVFLIIFNIWKNFFMLICYLGLFCNYLLYFFINVFWLCLKIIV